MYVLSKYRVNFQRDCRESCTAVVNIKLSLLSALCSTNIVFGYVSNLKHPFGFAVHSKAMLMFSFTPSAIRVLPGDLFLRAGAFLVSAQRGKCVANE